jgi:hypothetical protein
MRRVRLLKVDRLFAQPAEPSQPGESWPLYYWNLLAAALHLAQFVAVHDLAIANGYFGDDVPFVASRHELRYANTVVSKNGFNNSCVRDHLGTAVLLRSYGEPSPVDPRFYDFSNTQIIRYYESGSLPVSMHWLIAAFFLTSATFQYAHGEVLRRHPLAPRVLHCVEYALSSSLCVAVLALNVGIHDAYAITGVFGLFFGVNMLSACAELLMCLAEAASSEERDASVVVLGGGGSSSSKVWNFYPLDAWILPHSAAWVLFESSWGLVFAQYVIMYHCSEREPPAFMLCCIVLQSAAFVAFGIVQHWALRKRRALLMDELHTVYYELFDCVTWILFGYFIADGLIYLWDAVAAVLGPRLCRHPWRWPFLCFLYVVLWFPLGAFVHVCKRMRDRCATKGDVLWYMDAWMIGLSLFAKTTLAWLLLGPTVL